MARALADGAALRKQEAGGAAHAARPNIVEQGGKWKLAQFRLA
jgi:hypothetical protein